MAATISTSMLDSDIWMIKNSIYFEYIYAVIKVLGDSPLIEELKLSVDFNGISLEEIHDHKSAIEVSKAMRKVAHQICCGQYIPISFRDLNHERCKNAFHELIEILARWEKQNYS